jgi:hypothetical protein
MTTVHNAIAAVAVALAFQVASLPAADRLPTYTSPKAAGVDFTVQGEYTGRVGGTYPVGVQVIALGQGLFEGIIHGGGLPGAGWDGHSRYYLKGKRNGDTTTLNGVHGERLMFANQNVNITIRDGQLTGHAMMFLNQAKSSTVTGRRTLRTSPTLGAKPPPSATVLFDGTTTDQWIDGKIVDGNLLAEGTRSKRLFQNYRMHLEFRTPFMPTARGMQRGNSGVYLQELWEIQVVDSFGWTTENRKYERLSHVGRCGGIHELVMPTVNMCLPPLAWQTYDIVHTAARVDDNGVQSRPAVLSVRHNGVLIHDRYIVPPTPASSKTLPNRNHLPGRLRLQNHGNPVRFRNIWVVEKM